MQEAVSIDSFVDILDLWETDAEIGRICGVPGNNIAQWRRRQKIPTRYWRKLLSDLPNQGVEGLTVDHFLDLEEIYIAPKHRTMAQKAAQREATRKWRMRKKAGLV